VRLPSTLKVGDSITVWDRSEPKAIRTVAALTARKVTDSAGHDWIASSGHGWGTSGDSWYNGPHIAPTQEDDAARLNLRVKRRKASEMAKAALLFTESKAATAAELDLCIYALGLLDATLKPAPSARAPGAKP